MDPVLVALAIRQVPAVIDLLRGLFRKARPDQPEPTDAEVIAAFNQAFISSLAVDEQWLAAHPKT